MMWTSDEILSATGGRLQGAAFAVDSVAIDGRKLEGAALFMALKGARFDGHDFLQQAFEQAQKDVKTLTKRPSNDDMLALYSLYKQGSEGDVKGSRPGMMDMINRAKFDAWEKLKGNSKDAAMQKYVDKVSALMKSHK